MEKKQEKEIAEERRTCSKHTRTHNTRTHTHIPRHRVLSPSLCISLSLSFPPKTRGKAVLRSVTHSTHFAASPLSVPLASTTIAPDFEWNATSMAEGSAATAVLSVDARGSRRSRRSQRRITASIASGLHAIAEDKR